MQEAREIKKIIVHCADTPDGKYFDVNDIDRWHKERGFKASSNGKYCGYHWVILIDGTIEMGRMENDIGAHCYGHNGDSVGVCLIGRSNFCEVQKISLFYILDEICFNYKLTEKDVYGHYEFNEHKTCPNMDMNKIRDELAITLKLRGGSNGS